jgi:hypothetical protein
MAMSTAAVLLFGLLVPALTFAQTRKPLPLNSREFWTIIKTALTAPDSQDYFENNLKGSMIPGGAGGVVLLTGTLLSAEPVAQPTVLIVAISDAKTPEATLRFEGFRMEGYASQGAAHARFRDPVRGCARRIYKRTLHVNV